LSSAFRSNFDESEKVVSKVISKGGISAIIQKNMISYSGVEYERGRE